MNEYNLRTIKQITNVVNENNIDNFLIDFGNFLRTRIGFKKLGLKGIAKMDFTSFKWIDDGKTDIIFNIKPLVMKNGFASGGNLEINKPLIIKKTK